MEEKKIIKQFSAKVEASTGEDSDKFLYVKAYISTYDEDLGKDKILPGAFTKSIKERTDSGKNIPLLLQHNMDWLLGHAISIVEDTKGILVESRLPKSHWRVRDEIIPLLENGSLQEMSIGFILIKYSEDEQTEVRIIEEAKLLEYSFVTLAMNPEATIESYKSMIEEIKTKREAEKLLKQKGFSSAEAKTFISVVGKLQEFSKTLRDDEQEEKESQRDVEEKTTQSIDEEAILKSIDKYLILNQLNKLCR